MKTKEVHITEIMVGDTVLHYGEQLTVCKGDIKQDPFMGRSLFGDTYRAGYQKVLKVEFR